MISNGTIIVAKGNYLGSGTCSGSTPDTVDVCVDGTTLADVSSSSSADCSALAATTFHIASNSSSLATFSSSVLTSDTVTASTNIFNALKPGSTTVRAITSDVK